jgi:hypothetical protein
MSTTNEKYNSKGVPHSTFFAEVFRLSDPDNNASGVSLGTYLFESVTRSETSTLNKRPGIDGGKNGWWIVGGDVEGSFTCQLATSSTPTLQAGDYFNAAIRRGSDGQPVSERFVIHSVSDPREMGQYQKQSGSIIVDDQV